MKSGHRSIRFLVVLSSAALFFVVVVGCSQEQASEALKEAEASTEGAVESMAGSAGEMMEKGGEMASEAAEKGKEMVSELGENAMAFMTPIKEKLGSLEGLKETPEKLRESVTELISSIEEKAEGISLPESISKALATVKEKLVALKSYLEGEYEQAKINEKVDDIMSSVTSGLGMSSN